MSVFFFQSKTVDIFSYPIRPNYHTVHLDFLKLLNKLVVKYQPIKALFKERSAEDLMRSVLNDAFAILFSDFLYKFELS